MDTKEPSGNPNVAVPDEKKKVKRDRCCIRVLKVCQNFGKAMWEMTPECCQNLIIMITPTDLINDLMEAFLPNSKFSEIKIPEVPTLPHVTLPHVTLPHVTLPHVGLPDLSDLGKMADDWFPGLPDLTTLTPLKAVGRAVDFDHVKKETEEYYKTLSKSCLEDAELLVPELITKYGYPQETHLVTTEDGYILTMHRISHGILTIRPNKIPIILVHGLLSSSADWLITGPEFALGYILADAGYDVWLANCRGNRYSRNHTHIRPDSSKFWDFSFHDIAVYDIKSMIDFILKTTGEEKVYYIGHSQGTTVSYVLCAEMPEYNEKIGAIISLAPIGFMNNLVSPILRLVSALGGGLELVTGLIGDKEFMPHSNLLSHAAKFFACDGSPTQILCTNSLFMVCGFSPKQINTKLLPIMMGHTPSGMSTKQLLHYGQEWRSSQFCQWDCGLFNNNSKYGQRNPPQYDLSKITCPVYLFYSNNDWISHEYDVGRLFLKLTGTKDKEAILVGDGSYNHLDYVYGMDAPNTIYPLILEKLSAYTDL